MRVEDIIEGCRRGDPVARRELYNRYSTTMYGVVRRYVKDEAMAEDLLHDGFVTLYTKINTFRGEGSFDGWSRRIFANTALCYLRRQTPQFVDETQEYNLLSRQQVSPEIIDALSTQELKECIDSLPLGYKTILNLYAVEGYSHQEIAQQLNISETTSRSQYSRARAKLADILRKKREHGVR